MSKNRIWKLGVLGVSEGISIMKGASDSPDWDLACICDLDEVLCRKRQQQYPARRYTLDYADMLADPELDAIAIYTPDPLHAEHCRMAFEAGKHVICTKPLLKDLADGAELLRLSADKGLRLMVGQSCRFFGSFMRQREDVEAGLLGQLVSAEAHYNGDKRPRGENLTEKQRWVNWLYTGMTHPVDLVYWHMGPVETVSGVGVTSPASAAKGLTIPDCFHFTFKHTRGGISRVSGAYGTPPGHPDADTTVGCTLRAEKGTTTADYPRLKYWRHLEGGCCEQFNDDFLQPYYFPFGGSMHHVGEFRNYLEYFGRCLADGSGPRPDLRDGLQVIATITAMEQALAGNVVVSVPDVLVRHGLDLTWRPTGDIAKADL